MELVQIFLPLYDNNKQLFSKSIYDNMLKELKDEFGGVTFYRNSSAEGLWENEQGKTDYDELVIAEVMIGKPNKNWWEEY